MTNEELSVKDTIDTIKQRAKNESVPVRQIYQEEQTNIVQKLGDTAIVAKKFPQYLQVKSSCYNLRNKDTSKMPDNLDDLQITGEFAETIDHKRFLLANKTLANGHLVIFCTDIGLKILSESKRWQTDGTFECTPLPFFQVYIIHAWYKRKMLQKFHFNSFLIIQFQF
jgi:hypothetical protein